MSNLKMPTPIGCGYVVRYEKDYGPGYAQIVGRNVYTAEALRDVLEQAAKLCDLFQERDVGMQPAECAWAIRALIKDIQ